MVVDEKNTTSLLMTIWKIDGKTMNRIRRSFAACTSGQVPGVQQRCDQHLEVLSLFSSRLLEVQSRAIAPFASSNSLSSGFITLVGKFSMKLRERLSCPFCSSLERIIRPSIFSEGRDLAHLKYPILCCHQ
eukprot:4262295-Amphidinium_carterae.1